jgi:hypothetical protein
VNQQWFEMPEVRRRRLETAVWIPLRASQSLIGEGRYGFVGHLSEFWGAGSLMVPLEKRQLAEKLDWMEVGISQNQSGAVEKGIYVPADEYRGFDGTPIGIHLVLDQRGNRIENPEWHLHQDFVTTLGLKRENDNCGHVWTQDKNR